MDRNVKYAIAAVTAVSIGFFIPIANAVSATTTNEEIAASKAVISACDTSWDLQFSTPVYDATDNRYEIAAVTFSGVDNACRGQSIAVTVFNNANAALSQGTAVIAGATGTITLAAPVSVTDATGTASAIYE